MMLGHPRERTLTRYAEGTLDDTRRARVARHLAGCARCRATVTELRALGASARDLPDPPLPANALARIMARRAQGERVLLPTGYAAEPRAPHSAATLRVAVVALVVALVGGLMILRAPVATAQASDLRILVERPRAGARIPVAYVGSAALGGAERLTLRARLRTRNGEAYNRGTSAYPVATLVRGDDGTYRGAFQLPDSVVYALLVVEREDGSVVDHNGRRGWEVLVHGDDGRPLADALVQRANDMMGRDWEEAYRSAIQLSHLYPEELQSWNLLDFYERQLFGAVDSLRASHRARLMRFHERLADRPVTGDDAGWMMWYARGADDSVTEAFWRRRLIAEHGSHPLAVQERVSDLAREFRSEGDTAAVLARFERLWQEVGPAHSNLPLVAGFVAQAAGDTAAMIAWADRYALLRRGDDGAYMLLEEPRLREEGKRRLRARIARIEALPDSARGLFETREEFARRSAAEARDAYAALGEALLADGARAAGLETLARAIDGGWDPRLFRTVADARLGAGDTAGALALYAKVAVDPAVDASFTDTVRARLGREPDRSTWEQLLVDARRELRDRVLADARNRPLGQRVRLVDAGGTERDLTQLRAGRAAVVVFWSRHCGPALEQLPDIIRLSAALEARGARLVLVTEEQRSRDLTRFLAERAPGLELYHDQWRDATIAFQSWGTPQYFVVDSDGRLRFEYSELDDVLRQLEAVSPPVRSASSAVEPEARGAQRMANGDASQLARRSAGSS